MTANTSINRNVTKPQSVPQTTARTTPETVKRAEPVHLNGGSPNGETRSEVRSAGRSAGRMYPQKLTLYHPNSGGTGAAMQMEPRLNRNDSDRYNCFFLEMASQRSAAARSGDQRVPASFDWANKLTVKLDFADICEMLAVLEGHADKLGGQKNGLFHKNGNSSTIISLQKADKGGYFLGLSRKGAGEEAAARVNILLTDAEAIGLRTIFQAGLFFITFHSHIFQPAA